MINLMHHAWQGHHCTEEKVGLISSKYLFDLMHITNGSAIFQLVTNKQMKIIHQVLPINLIRTNQEQGNDTNVILLNDKFSIRCLYLVMLSLDTVQERNQSKSIKIKATMTITNC